MRDVDSWLAKPVFNIIASVIKKNILVNFSQQKNPYELSMLFCMKQLTNWLCNQGENGKSVHVIFESRGKTENKELELEFNSICKKNFNRITTNTTSFPKIKFTPMFISKQANSIGLQLADLIARPVGLKVLRPTQKNQAFSIIREKLIKDYHGNYSEKGLTVFPV